MSSKTSYKIGVVGATGMVGQTFMSILEERQFPISELRPFASENSLGKSIKLNKIDWNIQILKSGCFTDLDFVFFSSGDDISKEWAPRAVESGAIVIDNSGAFRMAEGVLLIVPEVNGNLLRPDMGPQIIANPNCSTIQLVMALKPLSDQFGLSEVRVSTYQAVSGGGQAAYDELIDQCRSFNHDSPQSSLDRSQPNVFPHRILFNLIPQIGSIDESGFCTEELKIIKETKKILGSKELKVSAFTVRVPVLNAHSESVWVTLKKQVRFEEVRQSLIEFPGISVIDEPKKSSYPMPISSSGQNPVFVGRIHNDFEDPLTWLMWIVSDNIRKGAALNGIQIAERLIGRL